MIRGQNLHSAVVGIVAVNYVQQQYYCRCGGEAHQAQFRLPLQFYILHKDKTEHARTIFCLKLSINNHIVRLVHKKHTGNRNVSDVPRSLQS